MRFVLLAILILTYPLLAFGQPGSSTFSPQNFQSWTLAPLDEEFSVETPAAFESNFINNPKDVGRRYYGSFNGTYYYIFSDEPKNPYLFKTVMDFAGQDSTQPSPAATFKLRDAYGYYYQILVFKTYDRIYTFQTTSPIENSAQVNNFFNRIKINGYVLNISKKFDNTNKITLSIPQTNEGGDVNNGLGSGIGIGAGNGVSETDIGTGGGLGSGYGRSNGNNGGNRAGTSTQSNNNSTMPAIQTTPLKILSKPRAEYTDIARFYQMTGSVRVRIIFMADGTIGNVAAINTLPFGLTEQALKAAKKLTFEPPTRDGQPYNVTKIVEYGFSLF